MFAAYHAVQCAAKCDVTAMRVSFCGMDASATPFPAGGTQIPAARAAQGSKEETPCTALGCTSKCHSKLHALLCPDCILILSHQCGLQGSRPERANRPLQTLRPKLILTLCFLQLLEHAGISTKIVTKIQSSFDTRCIMTNLNLW
jgi:hypothetical protein